MKVVIDTSVLISAVFRNRTPEEVVLFIAEHPECEWLVSSEILEEYQSVLRRPKFALPEDILNQWFKTLDDFTTIVSVDTLIDFPRDHKDAKFIACALAAQADFFITGDQDFDEARKMMKTTIISVAIFKRLVCDTYE